MTKRHQPKATVLPVHFEDRSCFVLKSVTVRSVTQPSMEVSMRHVALILAGAIFLAACSKSAPPVLTTSGPNATITGTVVERVDGPPYSFLRLETEKGQVWVAVPMADVPKKSRLTVKNGAVLRNFESKQAGRKFEAVVFGVMER
jgi:starvation-inducible outer membrane lipoprotein